MGQDERLLLGSTFGAAATAYAEHRPDYAEAAVRWALELAPGARVLDLGAGTGKLTATLVQLGAEVVAVEPDPSMLAELRRALPTVRALAGSAEAIPLPDSSVDAAVAGNAMHWFDMNVAGPEIARAVQPGGSMAGLWNVVDDRVDWVAGLERVGGSAAIGPRDTFSSWRAATAEAHLPDSGSIPRFGSPEQAEFPHGQRRDADSLVATLATRAGNAGNARSRTSCRARADRRVPRKQTGDRPRRVRAPDADRRPPCPATVILDEGAETAGFGRAAFPAMPRRRAVNVAAGVMIAGAAMLSALPTGHEDVLTAGVVERFSGESAVERFEGTGPRRRGAPAIRSWSPTGASPFHHRPGSCPPGCR